MDCPLDQGDNAISGLRIIEDNNVLHALLTKPLKVVIRGALAHLG
jgi:hypothetical protein